MWEVFVVFGYILINEAEASEEEMEIYRRLYCGVCHSLKTDYGEYCRSTLSYDMTFLALVLQSIAVDEPKIELERCPVHPGKPHEYYAGDAMNYAAAMNILLTWYKCLDDWQDDRNLIRYGGTKLFGRPFRAVEEKYPRQCKAVKKGLDVIAEMERTGELNPDRPAAVFGEIFGEIFVPDAAMKSAGNLRAFGNALGRFIYIADAVCDLKKDLKKERYNPLIAITDIDDVEVLSMLLADCTAAYSQLKVRRWASIIENVLYSGVWIRYSMEKEDADNDEGSL